MVFGHGWGAGTREDGVLMADLGPRVMGAR